MTLIPPPRQHLLRYHGCFAPRSALRLAIVPRIPKRTHRRLARRLTIVPSQPDSQPASHPTSHPASPHPEVVALDATPASATHSPSDACPVSSSDHSTSEPLSSSDLPATLLPRRLDWAGLLQRVFDIDVSRCAHCGGRVRILAVLAHPDIAHPVLEHLGLPTRLPAPAPRGPRHSPTSATGTQSQTTSTTPPPDLSAPKTPRGSTHPPLSFQSNATSCSASPKLPPHRRSANTAHRSCSPASRLSPRQFCLSASRH